MGRSYFRVLIWSSMVFILFAELHIVESFFFFNAAVHWTPKEEKQLRLGRLLQFSRHDCAGQKSLHTLRPV